MTPIRDLRFLIYKMETESEGGEDLFPTWFA